MTSQLCRCCFRFNVPCIYADIFSLFACCKEPHCLIHVIDCYIIISVPSAPTNVFIFLQELKDFGNSVDLTETFKFVDEKFTYEEVRWHLQIHPFLLPDWCFIKLLKSYSVVRISTTTCTIRWIALATTTTPGTSKIFTSTCMFFYFVAAYLMEFSLSSYIFLVLCHRTVRWTCNNIV